ncbi:MAG TPA: hypothetical protein DDZ89_16570, partial [Clostridiales bacterium]|nr:hypothetical protein [Clostridiales bacterium]
MLILNKFVVWHYNIDINFLDGEGDGMIKTVRRTRKIIFCRVVLFLALWLIWILLFRDIGLVSATASSSDAYTMPFHMGELKLDSVILTIDQSELDVWEQSASTVQAYLTNGTPLNAQNYNIIYTIDDQHVAEISSDGSIKAIADGTAYITATVIYENIQKSVTQKVTVIDDSEVLSISFDVPDKVYVGGKGALTPIANMESGSKVYLHGSAARHEIITAVPEDVITITDKGMILGNKAGVATIKTTIQFKGENMKTEPVNVHVLSSGKKNLSIWTQEQRENARENIELYSWAKTERDQYLVEANKAVNSIDRLYESVVAEGLPRYYFVGEALDPERFNCRYCKTNIAAKYGLYSWRIDTVNDPWKIRCPECKRLFPSNDFGSFYELGKDEHGVFNIELAHKRNDELIARGEPGYLVNTLYPEKGEGWGVDDGFGYFPGNTYPNGVVERHNYIAYYLHEGLWHGGLIDEAIQNLTYAYIYTGEAKYGRAGAILLDRIADFYPGFNWHMWRTFRGDSYKGKILDVVWENSLAQSLARAYDAFFPAFEDSEVIAFLSAKSKKYGQDNPKDCATAIRKNIEEGILQEIFNASVEGKIAGNFGMTQLSVATAAVALDCMPQTGEWLDWIMKPDENEQFVRPAGNVNILEKLINVVDRDGMGNEASPGYNSLWLTQLLGVAELLNGYETYPGVDLYKNPKFVNMFTAQLPLMLAGYYTMQIGDSGGTATTGYTYSSSTALTGFKRFGEPKLAQFVYAQNGNSVTGLHDDITAKDPEKIQRDILDVIDQYGTFNLGSDVMTGYGFASVRDGANYPSPEENKRLNTLRDFSIYFGIGNSHGHNDALNLGIDAFGLNLAPDLGYPEDTGTQPNRVQWVSKPLSHNTVMVNGKAQNSLTTAATPLHFDDSGRVKVMDIDATKANPETQEFRRTLVMIQAEDETSYGVDFFRILGGDDHVYSFHSQSDEIFETIGLNLVPQTDKDGKYIGTYASPDVPWGEDPDTIHTSWSSDYLKYPPGSTWLDHVRRDSSPSETFSVDFQVKDFRRVLKQNKLDLHLRMTMLNDFALDEVAIAHGTPPQVNTKVVPYLEYVLARRTGENLDTLFTTVYEPYKETRILDSGMESVPVETISGTPETTDTVKAVRIPLKNGRVDYVVYASNNNVLYRVDGLFDFRGFVGVYSLKNGEPVYMYINDGDTIGESTGNLAACTGKVKDFTRDLALDNTITITPEQEVDLDRLVDQYIYVINDGVQNGAYRIEHAEKDQHGDIILHIGQTSPVRSYLNPQDFDQGYVYNVGVGQSFRIPLPNHTDYHPVFDLIEERTVNAKTELKIPVSANSLKNKPLVYKAVDLPKGAKFDPGTKMFTWEPGPWQIGQHYV